MAEGHGGARPGSGRKPMSPAAKAERRAAAAARHAAAVIEPPPPPMKLPSPDVILDLIKRGERKAAPVNPFQLPAFPKAAMPNGVHRMAMDEFPGWGAGDWTAAILNSTFNEGLSFLGYPYLAELAQRPEYRVISETIADDATREWIDFEVTGDENENRRRAEQDPDGEAERMADPDERKKRIKSAGKTDKVKELRDDQARLEVSHRFYGLARDDGFFGRSHLYLDFGQGDDLGNSELKTDVGDGRDAVTQAKVGKGGLKRLKVIEAVWTYPIDYNANNPLKDDWYNPQIWYVMGAQIHRSRLPMFVGHPVPDMLKPAYSFGGIALSQMAKPYVDIWLKTRQSVGDLIHSFSVMVLMTDMQAMLQGHGGADLFTRIALFNQFRDNAGTFVLNKNTEDFKNVSASIAGLHELQAQAQEHLTFPGRIPLVKLTGIQPSGLNASSEGEIQVYDDTIAAYQNRFMRPGLTRVVNFEQMSLWGEVDPEITFVFKPLREASPKEKADLGKAEAERDQIFVDGGAISTGEWRKTIINNPELPFTGLDPDEVPEPPMDPMGGEGGPDDDGNDPKPGDGEERGGAEDAVLPFAGDAKQAQDLFNDPDRATQYWIDQTARWRDRDRPTEIIIRYESGKTGGGRLGDPDDDEGSGEGGEGDAADAWNEGDHPRGQPGNAGQFGSGGGGKTKGGPKQSLQAPQFGMPHGFFTASHGETAKAPRGPRNIGAPLDVGSLKKVGAQKGSNPGGVYEGEGKKFYVKQGKSKDHVKNEMIAAALYDLAGTPTLNYRPVKGGDHIATEMENLDKDNAAKLSPAERQEAAKDFSVHAWLGNWDAVGTGGDNLGTIKGVPTPLDLGGALEYRARGAPKGKAFGSTVGELDTLRDPKNRDAAGIFGKMTPAQMRESARYVIGIKDEKIKATVEKLGGSAALADKLIARKKDIAEKMLTFGAEGDPKKPDSTIVVPMGGTIPVKELNGVKFTPWREPSDWSGVDGQADVGEPEFTPTKGKQGASGVLIREKDGRVWLVQPRGGFGGYEATFPKGRIEEGLSMQANAIKEAYEETGLKVRITGFAGDHDGDMTSTRYYYAEREAGDPSKHDDESEGVVLVPPDKAKNFLNRVRDRNIIGARDQALDAKKTAQDETDAHGHEHAPAGSSTGGQFVSQGGGGGSSEGGSAAESIEDIVKAYATIKSPHIKIGKTAKETHALTVANVMKATAPAGSNYRRLVGKLIKEAKQHGGESAIPQLTKKLIESLGKTRANLIAKGELDEAEKVLSKMEALGHKFGESIPGVKEAVPPPPKPAPVAAPAPPPNPAAPSKHGPATAQELEKAKKTIPLQLQYVPGAPQGSAAAQKLVDKFNETWANKPLSPADLQKKVDAFKDLAASMGPLQSAEQQAAAAQAKAQAAAQAEKNKAATEALKKAQAAAASKNKEYMAALGISETEAMGFNALVEMHGGTYGGGADLVEKFKGWEHQAKQLGYPISGFQYALLRDYIDGGYTTINPALRSKSWTPAQHVYAKMVNNAIDKLPKFTGNVLRGANLNAQDLEAYKPGHVMTETAFTSTGIGFKFSGRNTHFTIKATGKRGGDLSKGANKGEKEVLFKARTNFLVHKVEKKGSVTYIEMEEVEAYD
jgi:phage-related protein (TIGR01555 family)